MFIKKIVMQPYEIRSELVRRQVLLKDIAARLGIATPSVSQVIYGVRPTLRIQEAIADAIKIPVDDVFPKKPGAKMNSRRIKGLLMAATGRDMSDLAKEHGCHPQTWSNVIAGRNKKTEHREAISRITNHQIADLWPDDK